MRLISRYLLIIGVIIGFSFVTGRSDRYFDIAKNIDLFTGIFKELNNYYVDDIEPNSIMEAGIRGMLSSLDPYTTYISQNEIEDFRAATIGVYGGIGALVGNRKGKIRIIMLYEGYPAHKMGLRVGDEIAKIDTIDISNRNIGEITDLLKGEINTSVTISVRRYGIEGLKKFSLVRDKIRLKNVPYYGVIHDEIGLIVLRDFAKGAAKEVKNAYENLINEGCKKIILDMRGNPGGLLNEAIDISNLFLPSNVEIVSTKSKVKDWNRSHKTTKNPLDLSIPLVVLINGSSASASEIVAGSIQDYDRGVIIGQQSFGKGLVQTTRPLSYRSQLKITVAKYYIPSGRCIQRIDYSNNKMSFIEEDSGFVEQVFYTKNGRPVYGSHGINPDIKISKEEYSDVLNQLLLKGYIFDYANYYAFNHPTIDSIKNFHIEEQDFYDFLEWIEETDYNYISDNEKLLNSIVTASKKKKYYEDIESEIERLQSLVSKHEDKSLLDHKDEIIEFLEREILSNFYLEKGYIESSFDEDRELLKAIEILGDISIYRDVLDIAN